MTDYEAYELLVKYTGEKGISLIKDMIQLAGVEKCIQNIEWAFKQEHKTEPPEDVKAWLRQSIHYINTQIAKLS